MYRTEWDGDEILARVDRAIGRSVISIGEQTAAVAKTIVHVESGTLRRSIHTALPTANHASDEEEAHGVGPAPQHTPGVYLSDIPGSTHGMDLAQARDHLLNWADTELGHPHIAIVEVGSWIAYACVEETGRQHHYMLPAVDMTLPTGWVTIETAFREEGL